MKNKFKPLLLATALILSPISQIGGAYASELPPQQEVVESIEKHEVKDGDNKIKIKEAPKKEIKNQAQTSKDDNEMKIVEAIDNKSEANYITVISNNSDNKPLKGFKYRLINDDTKKEIVLDFEEKSELIARVPDGSYTIKFVSGPKEGEHEKYTVENDVKLTLPKEDKNGSIIKEAKVMLKHALVKEKTPTNPKTMDDKNIITPILLIIGAILVSVFLWSKKDKDEKMTKQA